MGGHQHADRRTGRRAGSPPRGANKGDGGQGREGGGGRGSWRPPRAPPLLPPPVGLDDLADERLVSLEGGAHLFGQGGGGAGLSEAGELGEGPTNLGELTEQGLCRRGRTGPRDGAEGRLADAAGSGLAAGAGGSRDVRQLLGMEADQF